MKTNTHYGKYYTDDELSDIQADLHMDGECGGPLHCTICDRLVDMPDWREDR